MKPPLGRSVRYRYPDGEIRAAIIVRVWSDTCVNLQVLLDGGNDSASGGSALVVNGIRTDRPAWVTSAAPIVVVDPDDKTSTVSGWFWPPRA